jgi:DDE superfamily endonuclease
VILDGKIIPCDRCKEPARSFKGEAIDLWYSGKAHTHGGNIQAVLAPDGFPLWVSGVEPGSVHDITAARLHALPALYRAAAEGLATLADPGYGVRASASTSRSASPPQANSISATAHATLCSGPCAAWANTALPCSPAAGGHSSTSPSAPARSAIPCRQPWSSPFRARLHHT